MANNDNKMRHIAITYACNRDCEYCYAKHLNKTFKPMRLEQFNKVIEWLEKQDIKYVSLIGGEPTFHKNFNEILELLAKRNFSANILTNGIFESKILETSWIGTINNYFINYNPLNEYNLKEKKLLQENLKKIKNITSNLNLRLNIFSKKTSYQHIIEACRKYDINSVSYALSTPNVEKTNEFVKIEHLKSLVSHLIDFVEACQQHGIRPKLARPLPFCIFSSEERIFLRRKSELCGRCVAGENTYVINPDLTIYPCVSLHMRESKSINLIQIDNEKKIFEYYKKVIENLKWNIHIFTNCETCKFLRFKKCQGGCLTYKFKLNMKL